MPETVSAHTVPEFSWYFLLQSSGVAGLQQDMLKLAEHAPHPHPLLNKSLARQRLKKESKIK